MDKLWLVKSKKGRIFGPYTKEEIIEHIESKRFLGEEFYCSYPSGEWEMLSSNKTFYEHLIKNINKTKTNLNDFSDDSMKKDEEDTLIIKKPEDEKLKQKQVKVRISGLNTEDDLEEDSQVIAMEDVRSGTLKRMQKALLLPAMAILALGAFAFVIVSQDFNKSKNQDKVRILTVGKKRTTLKKEEIKKIFQQASLNHSVDQIPNYIKAQSQFIKILSSAPKNLVLYNYLCLVHLEIWPFAYQDTRDRRSISKLLNRLNTFDKGGIYSGLCNAVNALIENKPNKALMIIDSSLNVLKGTSPVFFYYIKARSLKDLSKNNDSRYLLQSIYKLYPKWVAPYMLDAQMYYEEKNFSAATKRYQKVLSIVPGHESASLRLGVLEYNYLKKLKKSEKRLKSTLTNSSSLINPQILLESYQVLSEIYLKQGDKKEALAYAKKAYALNPSDDKLALLITRLGSKESLKNTPIKARQLIYQGDILASKGNCSEASNYYKRAYNSEQKKNALAAIRIAKCLWQSKISGQAIQWLKRAIAADPKMVEAYFLLVDYLSENYDFQTAQEILSAAYKKNPSSYEIYKAHAILAFRQKQYRQSIAYAERSLKIYSSDVEVYVLLNKAYRALKNYNKAYLYAQKSIEEDINSVSGQIGYAFALGSAYGFTRGESYLQKLISSFPLVLEYSQALGEYYFEYEEYKKALSTFQSVVKHSSDMKSAYIYLGRIHIIEANRNQDQERFQLALRSYIKASLLDTADPEPLFRIGLMYLEQKSYHPAEEHFDKVLKLNPNYPLIHYYIGRANFLQGGEENLERALKSAKTEAQKNPNVSLAYVLMGDIYKKKALGPTQTAEGRRTYYGLCAKQYQKAIKINDKNIKFYLELMKCYKGSGDFDSAIRLANQVIEGEGTSGYPEMYRELGQIYEIKGQYERAQSLYEYYFYLDPSAPDRAAIEKRLQSYILKEQKPQ